jgi:hypothetical protein
VRAVVLQRFVELLARLLEILDRLHAVAAVVALVALQAVDDLFELAILLTEVAVAAAVAAQLLLLHGRVIRLLLRGGDGRERRAGECRTEDDETNVHAYLGRMR